MEQQPKQLEFIESQFRLSDEKAKANLSQQLRLLETRIIGGVDARLCQHNKCMNEGIDERFQCIYKQMQRVHRHLGYLDKRFDQIESEIKIRDDNAAAVTKNRRLRCVLEPINVPKVRVPLPSTDNPEVDEYAWVLPTWVPKNMKHIYHLGQCAKGVFVGNWEHKTKQEKFEAEVEAIETIRYLTAFYGITVFSDELSEDESELEGEDESESDAYEVTLTGIHVDEYMECLLEAWGMDWKKVRRLVKRHIQSVETVQTPSSPSISDMDTTAGCLSIPPINSTPKSLDSWDESA